MSSFAEDEYLCGIVTKMKWFSPYGYDTITTASAAGKRRCKLQVARVFTPSKFRLVENGVGVR